MCIKGHVEGVIELGQRGTADTSAEDRGAVRLDTGGRAELDAVVEAISDHVVARTVHNNTAGTTQLCST